jgi:hypothetical protein
MADATLVFGNANSPGCTLTRRIARQAGSPLFLQPWPGPLELAPFVQFLREHKVEVLNVAGNREQTNAGIFLACRSFVVDAIVQARG